MLRDFLKGDAEWIFYIDADVWIDPDAEAHPPLVAGCHAMPDPLARFHATGINGSPNVSGLTIPVGGFTAMRGMDV